MLGRCLAGLTVAIALLGVAARGSIEGGNEPDPEVLRRLPPPAPEVLTPPPLPGSTRTASPLLPVGPPHAVVVPEDAIRFRVDASGTVTTSGVPIDGAGVLARLRAFADRSRDADGVSRGAMAVVADAGTPWRAVRDVLSLCSHPKVRIGRVYLGTRGDSAIRLAVPRTRLRPRGPDPACGDEPRLSVSLARYARTLVELLDTPLGEGAAAFVECDRRIGAIHELNPRLPGEVRAEGSVPLRDVLRAHAMFASREIEVLVHRVPAVCWAMEEFYRGLPDRGDPSVCRALTRALGEGDFRVGSEAMWRLVELWHLGRHEEAMLAALREALCSESDRLRWRTLDALELFDNPRGLGPLVPVIVPLFDDCSPFISTDRVENLLVKIGSPAAEHFARVQVPFEGRMLERMGIHAAFGLLRALVDPDAAVRVRAAGLFAHVDSRCVRTLALDLSRIAREDPEPGVRSAVVRALGRAAVRESVPVRTALLDALVDRDPWLRSAAAEALVRCGYETTRALAVLGRDVLAGESAAVRSLISIHRHAEPAVPDLLAALSSRDAGFRRSVVRALGWIAPSRLDVRHALERIAADEDEDKAVRKEARKRLAD